MRCLRHSAGLVHTPLVSKCRWSRDGEGILRATYEELMRCAGRDRVRGGRRRAHPTGRPASASPGRAVSRGSGDRVRESSGQSLRRETAGFPHSFSPDSSNTRCCGIFPERKAQPPASVGSMAVVSGARCRSTRSRRGPWPRGAAEGEGGGGRGGRASRFRLPHLSNRPLCLPGRPPPGLFSAHSLTMPCP